MTRQKPRKLYKSVVVLLVVVLLLFTIFGAFCLGGFYQRKHWKFWRPDYEKIDIVELLEKSSRTKEDYAILYAQTGLTVIGVEDTLAQTDGKQIVLEIQKSYFRERTLRREYESPIMYQERTNGVATLAHLRDGDVLVSASTVVSWWRFGHSALVVDGDGGVILESIGVGKKSKYNAAEVFTPLAGFMVLRPKTDEETKQRIVHYAQENLVGLPYVFTVGIFSKKAPKKVRYTQCAHLVWYAYKRFGIDLDGDGGGLVLPQDIANSSNVEIVQIFGFHPERLWK